MRKLLVLLLCVVAGGLTHAQVAGMSTLAVLDMPGSARSAGVGFDFLSLYDDDVTLTLNNPSLISDRIDGQLALGFVNVFSGANFGSLAYSHSFGKLGSFTFGLLYGNYGHFDGYDENDQPMGSFTAADYVLSIGWGCAVDDHISVGATFKPILSQYDSYTAVAFGADLAATFMTLDHGFSATLMGRNIGAQLSSFNDESESLPFELSLSGSYKLQDAPFRLLFALTELQQWDLTYTDPLHPTTSTDPFTGEVTRPSLAATWADMFFRHLNMGLELNLGSSFFARVGYSYRQMVEMTGADVFNVSGFSFGLGVNAKRFRFSYSRNNYHLSQAANYINLSFAL